jgi:hypothetical protein
MDRAQFQHLDRWLATQVATGTRFTAGSSGCAMAEYAKSLGMTLTYSSCVGERWVIGNHGVIGNLVALQRFLHLRNPALIGRLYQANDRTHGNPAAVRAELHRRCPRWTRELVHDSVPVEPSGAALTERAQEPVEV